MRKPVFVNPISAIAIIALCFSLTSCSSLLASNDGRQLFPIVQNKKIGYMDKSGKVVINPQFDFGSNFSEGLAKVQVGGNWGYINPKGELLIDQQPVAELAKETRAA